MKFTEINVRDLSLILGEENPDIQFIDVREKSEAKIASLPLFKLLPLSEYPLWGNKIKELFNLDAQTIVMCHHGIRSANMCQWLTEQGFTNVKNVLGGIDAYSIYIDSSIPRY